MKITPVVPPSLDDAVEIAPRVWWVGSVLPGDEFQCHVYLLENGSESVLIDPGSPLTLPETIRKVEQIVPLSHIRWLVCHHADPDVAAGLPHLRRSLPRTDAVVVTEWRAEALLRHYDAGFPFYRVEDHDWRIDLGDGRSLEFQLTPYLHFPGAMVSYDPETATLFSADIFGGFVLDPFRLVATDLEEAFAVVKLFHQHYMPSRELLSAGLRRVQRRFPQIRLIAPQHGSVIPQPLVGEMFQRLDALECGVFQFAERDLELAHLLLVAETRERLVQSLLASTTIGSAVAGLISALEPLVRVADAELYLETSDGWLRIDRGTGSLGEPVARPRRASRGRPRVRIPGNPAAELSLQLANRSEVSPDAATLLHDLGPALRTMVDNLELGRFKDLDRAKLRRESERDPLTAALNRRGLERKLPQGQFAVVLVDLDHFKQVNDTFGHDAGDRVLRGFARTAKTALRQGDLIARIGGEEFAAVLPDTDGADAARVAERIIRSVEERSPTFGGVDRVTASAGVAVAPSPGPDADPVGRLNVALVWADQALYRAKTGGRNQVRVSRTYAKG